MPKINKTNDSSGCENTEKRNIYSLLVGMQSCTDTMEISIVVPQEAGNRSTSRFSYITLGHIVKGFYMLLQRYLLIPVPYCSIHNNQNLETA